MNVVINELKAKLEAIAKKDSLSSEDFQFLEACLWNKWYGIQVIASKVLVKFHPPKAAPLIKDWFLLHINHSSINHMAYRALLPFLKETDTPWLLELYFAHSTSYRTLFTYKGDYYIFRLLEHLLERFGPDEAVSRLLKASETLDNGRHILLLANVHWSRREDVFKSLLQNPNVPNKKDIKEPFWAASMYTRAMRK